MICPHCDKDTSASEPYCLNCGRPVELDFDVVSEAFDKEAEEKLVRGTELKTRKYLYLALGLLLAVIGARLALVPPVPRPHVLPARLVEPDLSRPAVPPLPLERLALEVPPP